jgi:hypothetical protein
MRRASRKESAPSGVVARNFSLPTEERVRAIAAGPPAHLRRLHAIEDLEEEIVRILVHRLREAGERKIDPETYARSRAPLAKLERLADLIERHNRWYPIEANLPMHPRTGELVDRTGLPWRPMHHRDLAYLLAQALAQVQTHTVPDSGDASLG